MTARAWPAAAVAAAALLAGCGDDGRAAKPAGGGPIALTVHYDDGPGEPVRSGSLTCAGTPRAGGALAGPLPATRLCEQARAIARLLTTAPAAGRRCTRIYGGPQTVRVRGTIDGRRFDRRVARTDGCGIADYGRVARALPVRR
jgi:hypothetical protein